MVKDKDRSKQQRRSYGSPMRVERVQSKSDDKELKE
jgi:hypothetical protein